MDLIVAVCRALANPSRLALLHVVHTHPEITVQELAHALKVPVDAASKHLKLLGGLHLVRAIPHGRYVKCSPASGSSTTNRFLRHLQVLLKEVMESKDPNRTLAQVCDSVTAPSWEAVWKAMEKVFTAYTHLRRLLLLRFVATHGTGGSTEMAENIGLSADALRRHLDKLERRRLLMATGINEDQWCLAPQTGPAFRRQMLELILRELKAT